MEYHHSVALDRPRCIGCTNCLKYCPTEAIRIRDRHAVILNERCIDCGECIRVCPTHAKVALTDPLGIINRFKYKIALPAPALFAQFKGVHNPENIIEGLFRMGFDHVFESAVGAELIAEAIHEKAKAKDKPRPLISSACPAIVRLIQVSYPSLIGNIVDVLSPMEVAAKIAKRDFCRERGVPESEVGVFYITPCSAKNTYIHHSPGQAETSIDGAISIQSVFGHLVSAMHTPTQERHLRRAGALGTGWGVSGGEIASAGLENALAVDGIFNVIHALEEIDNLKFNDLDYFEGRACTGGCVGGPLTVENSFVAKNRMRRVMENTPRKKGEILDSDRDVNLYMTKSLKPSSILQLGGTMSERITQMEKMNRILEHLPGLDCGSCGSPTCRTLAEDIVRGYATELNCIFKLKDRVKALAEQMIALSDSSRFKP